MRGRKMLPDRNRLKMNADFDAVRDVLCRLFPPSGGMDDDSRAIAELVLAEVLNNVVEHAYGGTGGRIDLSFRRGNGCLIFRVADAGRPYPAGGVPSLTFPAPIHDTCEGGFGWGLVHALAERVVYRRVGGVNILVFRVSLNNGAAAA
jgi:serine/threonine-protein kinase RsbW